MRRLTFVSFVFMEGSECELCLALNQPEALCSCMKHLILIGNDPSSRYQTQFGKHCISFLSASYTNLIISAALSALTFFAEDFSLTWLSSVWSFLLVAAITSMLLEAVLGQHSGNQGPFRVQRIVVEGSKVRAWFSLSCSSCLLCLSCKNVFCSQEQLSVIGLYESSCKSMLQCFC